MKIKYSEFRKKCLSEKYYASIKYMSHSLKGKERREFIMKVCDINIYLGSMCAITCEQDKSIDNYINKIINNYFIPKRVPYYDKKLGITSYTERRLRSFDIANYLLACNLIGRTNAINWYVNSHDVQKSILIQLAAEMNEDALIDFLLVLARSEQNKNKLRGIGSAKNLYSKKNDIRVKKLLTLLWNEDKDAYIQLAYDTGWLGDIWKNDKHGKSIYVHLLNKCIKQQLALEYILDSFSNEEEFLKILRGSKVGKRFLYLYYLSKINMGIVLSDEEYNEIRNLPEPSDKIKNYYIPFFLKLKKEVFFDNLNYARLFDSFYKVYMPVKKESSAAIGHTSSKTLSLIVSNTKKEEWRGLVALFINTYYGKTVSLDDLYRNINYYLEIQKDDFVEELSKQTLEAMGTSKGIRFMNIRTDNYIMSKTPLEDGIKAMVTIVDYDFIGHIVYVKINELNG